MHSRPELFAIHLSAVTVGLFFELFSDYSWRDGDPPDADAEYEPEETLAAVEQAFQLLGHETIRVGGAKQLLRKLDALRIDVGFNIAEGARSRNREAYVPVLLELADVPCIGSDALTLSASLDKALTKDLAVAAGVATPPYAVVKPGQRLDADRFPAPFPLFVKPRYEGSAKGIMPTSRVESEEEVHREVERVTRLYDQDALVEAFVDGGGEFTVCVVGNAPPRPLPVLQRAIESRSGIGIHALEHRGVQETEWDYHLGASLTPGIEEVLQRDALRVYEKLECLDFARMDFRTDANGAAWFLEANPLPTFAPDGTFAIVAELMGRPYVELLSEVFDRALHRLGLS